MSHLILPVEIDSTDYCPICQAAGGAATKGVLTTFHANPNQSVISSDCSPWQLFTGHEDSDEGEISFGIACGTTVELALTSTVVNPAHEYGIDIEFYIDGILDSGVFITETNPSDTASLIVSGGACGNLITVVANPLASIEDYYDATVTLSVTGIT
jgi:hypothetical protein